jgi:hypothetical protein
MNEWHTLPGRKSVERNLASGKPHLLANQMLAVETHKFSLREIFQWANVLCGVVFMVHCHLYAPFSSLIL